MMTAEGRKSPVHVHVDRETPVHVHLKKKKKGKAGVPTAVEVRFASLHFCFNDYPVEDIDTCTAMICFHRNLQNMNLQISINCYVHKFISNHELGLYI